MKHTMKKLLCMALVIMLLISAVPVFAAAEGEIALSIYYVCDSSAVPNWAERDVALAKTTLYNPETTTAKVAAQAALSVSNSDIVEKLGINTNYAKVKDVRVDVINDTQVNYTVTLCEVDKPTETTGYVDAKIYDGDTDTTKKIGVQCSLKVHTAPVYTEIMSIVAAPSADEVKSALGTAYANKSINSINTRIINGGTEVAVFVTTGSITSTTPGGSGSGIDVETPVNGGSGSGSNSGSGSGSLVKFKAIFLNANGIQFYSEEAVSNAKLTVSASTLNNGVGTKAGYEHIGWKSSAGKTQTTDELLRDTITSNVTYAPVFRNLTNNNIEVPGSGIISGGSSSSGSSSNGSDLHDKVSTLQDVVLHVYLNNNFNSEHKHYNITSIAKDGTLSLMGDVKDYLKSYYTAKTSDGIGYDGMYITDAYFGVKYLSNDKREVIGNDADANGNTSLDKMRSAGVVHLNVMLTNATAKSSSSTADSSNPKTGDTIFVPVMVMGLTASALAAAYVFGKKRFAR